VKNLLGRVDMKRLPPLTTPPIWPAENGGTLANGEQQFSISG